MNSNNAQNVRTDLALQDQFGPGNTCFGCGPSNPDGLKIKSFVRGDTVISDWMPKKIYEAFPSVLCGGIIGTILDCHANWTAAWGIYKQRDQKSFPYTVTAEYSVKLLRPTLTDTPLHMKAEVLEVSVQRATISGIVSREGEITATFQGIFVAVKPGHPAFGRW
jgi:hypothetical protein